MKVSKHCTYNEGMFTCIFVYIPGIYVLNTNKKVIRQILRHTRGVSIGYNGPHSL